MFRTLKSLAAVTALLASALLITPGIANAATMTAGAGGFEDGWATQITYDSNATRPTGANDRLNPLNALGATDGKFFSIGLGSEVVLTFGTDFDTSTTVWEVTFGNVATYPEEVEVYAGLVGGGYEFVGTILNNVAQRGATLALTGPTGTRFDRIKLVDISTNPPSPDGFDIDSVRVTPVPLPAAAWLFGSVLVGVGIIGRRKKRQAGDAAA